MQCRLCCAIVCTICVHWAKCIKFFPSILIGWSNGVSKNGTIWLTLAGRVYIVFYCQEVCDCFSEDHFWHDICTPLHILQIHCLVETRYTPIAWRPFFIGWKNSENSVGRWNLFQHLYILGVISGLLRWVSIACQHLATNCWIWKWERLLSNFCYIFKISEVLSSSSCTQISTRENFTRSLP